MINVQADKYRPLFKLCSGRVEKQTEFARYNLDQVWNENVCTDKQTWPGLGCLRAG